MCDQKRRKGSECDNRNAGERLEHLQARIVSFCYEESREQISSTLPGPGEGESGDNDLADCDDKICSGSGILSLDKSKDDN